MSIGGVVCWTVFNYGSVSLGDCDFVMGIVEITDSPLTTVSPERSINTRKMKAMDKAVAEKNNFGFTTAIPNFLYITFV